MKRLLATVQVAASEVASCDTGLSVLNDVDAMEAALNGIGGEFKS